jgi:hypothetical protein
VTENVPDINHSPFVLYRRNQPAPVMTDIEYNEASNYIRVFPTVPDVCEVLPFRVARDFVPGVKGCCPFSVTGARHPDCFSADDAHAAIFAFCEVRVKSGLL